VRIGPNELLSTDPDVLRMMSAARSPYTKGLFYETGRIIPGEETVVSLRDEHEHKVLRAKMGTAVRFFHLLTYLAESLIFHTRIIIFYFLSKKKKKATVPLSKSSAEVTWRTAG
jgi:hypothetical protein